MIRGRGIPGSLSPGLQFLIPALALVVAKDSPKNIDFRVWWYLKPTTYDILGFVRPFLVDYVPYIFWWGLNYPEHGA